MTSQWLASSLGSKVSGAGTSAHAPTASSTLPSAVKSWPPAGGGSAGGGALASAAWLSGLISVGLTSVTLGAPGATLGAPGAAADGALCTELASGLAPPLAG